MKKDKDNLKGLAEELTALGLKKGADEIEVSILRGYEFNAEVRMQEIENLVEAGSKTLSIKIIKDKKTAYASSEDFSREILDKLIASCLQRAELGNPDEFAGLPERKSAPGEMDIPALKLYDPEIVKLPADRKIKLALETERIGLADSRITNSHGASCGTTEAQTILVNSRGFSCEYAVTSCYLGLGLQAGTTDAKVEDYWYCSQRHFQDLEPPEQIAQKTIARTVRQLGAKKIETQNVPVVFEPEMSAGLLGFLFTCVSGMSIYQKASFLADKLGEPIGNELITVIDDGLMPGKLGSRPFDSEGVPAQITTVIDRGVLRNYLCNTYAARKLNLKSTGNCSGTGVGTQNFYMQAGKNSPVEIIKSVEKGLLLIRTIGHGLNPVTGDISRGAYGMWIEKGEIAYPVTEITISGNLGKMLNEIEMVGNDLEFRTAVSGPTIKFQELTIGGT